MRRSLLLPALLFTLAILLPAGPAFAEEGEITVLDVDAESQFPDGVRFSQTNSQPSQKSGWLMHSRQITGWGDAPSGVAWASHVRAVLSEAVE